MTDDEGRDYIFNALKWPTRADAPKYLTQELSEQNALPWQRYVSDEVPQGLMSRVESGDTQKTLLRGLDKAPDLSSPGLPGDSASMAEAIGRKYQGQVGDSLERIKSGYQAQAPEADELNRASTMLGQQERIRMQNFREQYDYQERRKQLYRAWKQAQDQATAGFIGQVLGLVGTGAGLLAGGPATAAGAAGGGGGGRVGSFTNPLT